MAQKTIDTSTEERIKEAARKVFTQKGFAAARVKDIAEEAGINLALLSYYFRGKEKLFDLIMLENLQQFAGSLQAILNNTQTSLHEKVQHLATFYIDLLLANPDLSFFILSEIRANPKMLAKHIGGAKLVHSHFIEQVSQELTNRNNPTNPIQIFMTLLGMLVFPFVGRPLIQEVTGQEAAQFRALMEERKKHIPVWFGAILSCN
ncbi:MAG: TetR family transcriptional regulator [Siphonobacter sp.]